MSQKIAIAFESLRNIINTSYKFIAYIGSQQVDGINHAILAEQIILTGKDVKNVVIIIFNEKGENITLVSIERIVESGQGFDRTKVDVQTLLSDDARNLFIAAFTEILDGRYTPIALLGTQMITGIEYIYAATCDPATLGDMKFLLISINSLTHRVSIINPLVNKYNVALGYAFNW